MFNKRVNKIKMNNKVCVITGASKYNAEFSKEDILQHLSAKVGNTYDIASTAWFICNNDFINAENIIVDGCMTELMIYHNDEGWKLDI